MRKPAAQAINVGNALCGRDPQITGGGSSFKRGDGFTFGAMMPSTKSMILTDPIGPEARGRAAITAQDRMRLDRGAAYLHTLGPRATAELLATVAAHICGAAAVLTALAEYEHLAPATVRAVGGHRFAPCPLHLVERTA